MIQSRFFHSSIQEIELHVKEIYSLQGELREKVLNSLNQPSTKIKNHEKNIKGLVNTSSILILSELSSTKLASSPTNDILENSTSEKLTSNNKLLKVEASRNQFDPRQPNNDARISDYGIDFNLSSGKKTDIDTSKEFLSFPEKNIDILIFSLSFFIWGINLIFLLFFLFL